MLKIPNFVFVFDVIMKFNGKKKLWYHSVANIITFCITVSAHFIHSATNIAHLQRGKSICSAHLTEPNIM